MDLQPAWKAQGITGLEKPLINRPKHLLRISLGILLSTSLLWLGCYLFNPVNFPINRVKIIDPQGHVDKVILQRESLPFVNNGFFRLSITALQQRLQQIPWVDQCEVTRLWPDQIVIRIIEQQPVAQWNEHNLINVRGELFNSGNNNSLATKLPLLLGPVNQQALALHIYFKLCAILMPIHLSISRLELTSRQAWQLTLQNGMSILLGREDLVMRLRRFVKLYPSLSTEKINNIDYADLRYSNGIAIHWKETNLQ